MSTHGPCEDRDDPSSWDDPDVVDEPWADPSELNLGDDSEDGQLCAVMHAEEWAHAQPPTSAREA